MDAAIERHRTVDNLTSLNKSSGLIFIRFIIIMIIDFFQYTCFHTFKTFHEYAQQYNKTDNVFLMLYLFNFEILI